MDKPLDLTGVNSINGYDAKLYFADIKEQEQRLLAQFDHVLVDIDSMVRRFPYALIKGQVDLVLFREIIKMEGSLVRDVEKDKDSLGNPNYQFVIEFTAEMIKPIPIGEFPEEAVITRHRIKLKNCVLASLPPAMIFGYATASLNWKGTAQDIVEVE
jgi:hypothetical protein